MAHPDRIRGASLKVLVTGGAGFIGSAVVRHLLNRGHEVLTLDMLTHAGSTDNFGSALDHARHRFLKVDICDGGAVADAFEGFRPDAVMHLAAETMWIGRSKCQSDLSKPMWSEARAYWTPP